jgi:hypothetical protein
VLVLVIGLVIQLSVKYLLVPFILMNVLLFLGVSISFIVCIGICFLVYVLGGVLKR